MTSPRVPLLVTSYHAHLSDHLFPERRGWYTCNPKGSECLCKYHNCYDADDADDDAADASDEEPSSCYTTSTRWYQADCTRYAITRTGKRKAMTRCCHGNESSMRDQSQHGLPHCQDAHYLIDGDEVIIDYLDAPPCFKPNDLLIAKHVRFRMNRGCGSGAAVGFLSWSNRQYKIEVDNAANVTLCKLKSKSKKRRPWLVSSDDDSESDDDSDSEDFNGSGPTPDQTTLFCNEFCRAVMYEAPRLRCFHTMASASKMKYAFSLGMFAKCILKWKELHMRCIGKKWEPGGMMYNELIKGDTAQTMCACPADKMPTSLGKRKHEGDINLKLTCEVVLNRPMSSEVM